MTRSELMERLAVRHPQLTAKDVELAVKLAVEAMGTALAEGKRIEIRGFGSFSLNHRRPRHGRNPKTGQLLLVPAKRSPHYKAGKELRTRVDIRP
jgi:integration host factor subunit beta